MTKPASRFASYISKLLCLPPCIPFHAPRAHSDTLKNIKIYVLVENCEAWGGVPLDMKDVFHGVFSSKEDAENHLWHVARYEYSLDTSKLFLVDGKAKDAEDHTYFEIIRGHIQ